MAVENHIISDDGTFSVDKEYFDEEKNLKPEIDPETGKPYVQGTLFMEGQDPELIQRIQDNPSGVVVIGRSSWNQLGLSTELIDSQDIVTDSKGEIIAPVKVTNLNSQLPELLRILYNDCAVGRIFFQDPELLITDPDEIKKLIGRQILLPKGYQINEDGSVDIDIGHQEIKLDGTIAQNIAINNIIQGGRARIAQIQYPTPLSKERLLHPGGFFVGTIIKISLGEVHALIDTQCILKNNPEETKIQHSSARLLDALRTNGSRQVEIINNGDESVTLLDNLKIKISLYRAAQDTFKIPVSSKTPVSSEIPVSRYTLKHGYHLEDLVEGGNLKNIFNLISQIKNQADDPSNPAKAYGIFINDGKAILIPWSEANATQGLCNELTIQRFNEATKNPLEKEDMSNISREAIQALAKNLKYISGKEGSVFCCHSLPPIKDIGQLIDSGVGTFVFVKSRRPQDPYAEDSRVTQDAPRDFFDPGQVSYLRECTHGSSEYISDKKSDKKKEGNGKKIRFVLFDPETEELRVFYKGLFIRPESIEPFDQVDYWFPFYGSHKENNGSQEALQEKLNLFMKKLKDLFGNKVGIIHGAGPGFMRAVDNAAKENGILRVGINIDLGKVGQEANKDPEAGIGIIYGARLFRQQLIEILGKIVIVDLGGFGTLEEIGITSCSFKLYENALSPIIIIDNNGHWNDVIQQVRKITEKELGSDFVEKLITVCKDYDEALQEIEKFVKNPSQWYQERKIKPEDIEKAREGAKIKASRHGFSQNHFEKPFTPQNK